MSIRPVMVEIYLLVLLNRWGVHEIAVATGLMGPNNKHLLAAEIIGIGLEDEHRGLLRYGIDSFLGLNRGVLFVFNLVLRLKGYLGSKLLRYLVQRLLGRFAVREVLDFIGMPIYMAINAYSTHVVLREARVIIMGQRLLEPSPAACLAPFLAAVPSRTPATCSTPPANISPSASAIKTTID